MRKLLILLLTVSVLTATVEGAPKREPQVIRLTLTPRATMQPALKYRFMPRPMDQVSGDAAPLYMMAMYFAHGAIERYEKVYDQWLDKPLDQLRPGEIPLGGMGASWVEFAEAAGRRKECDWGVLIKEKGYAALLPYLNNAREMVNVLAIQSRDAMVRNQPEEAIALLGHLYTLSWKLNHDAVIVQALVAAGCAQMASARVEELVQLPECPNLYWALADIPHPLVDSRNAVSTDLRGLLYSFPELVRARSGGISPEEFRQTLVRLEALSASSATRTGEPATPVQLAVTMMRLYPAAKRHLAENGMTPEQIDAMPAQQALAVFMLEDYERWADELTKWTLLPVPQALAGLQGVEESLSEANRGWGGSPMLRYIPAVRRSLVRFALVDRKIASLGCVEAVRAYAATHNGQPPQTLEAITDTPAPADPMTGRPFEYEVKEGVVIISAPWPQAGEEHLGWRYEITFRK